jgi:hypothetical protein
VEHQQLWDARIQAGRIPRWLVGGITCGHGCSRPRRGRIRWASANPPSARAAASRSLAENHRQLQDARIQACRASFFCRWLQLCAMGTPDGLGLVEILIGVIEEAVMDNFGERFHTTEKSLEP